MAFDTNDLVLHIKRLVYSSIRLGYRSACDYPVLLGAGIVLLFLHELCPSVFACLLSSSPVIVLTALLLGALLSYGEPTVPLVGEETLENQEILFVKSKISITDCSIDEVENVAVEAHLEKRTETDNGEVCVEERVSDNRMHDTRCEEKKVAHIAADTVLSEEVYVEEERTSNDNLHDDAHFEEKNVTFMADDTVPSAKYSEYCKSNVIVQREDRPEEISEKAELQEHGSTDTGSGNSGVHSQYQFGEFMRSCWQPVIRQELPCSDFESDLTDESSSPGVSMTDIIPMLEELHPLIHLGTGHPSLVSRDNLNSSSDDDEDDLEEDVSSDEDEGVEGQEDDGDNWEDVVDLNSLDMEHNSKLENLMELQRAKNILKFEFDKRLMDLQAADATRKLKEASSFHVQVPSISAARQSPVDPSKDSVETIELPQIPGSAPSVLCPRRNLFDLPFNRFVDHGGRFRETLTPRSYFQTRQHRKHRKSYGQQHSTCQQHHNGIKQESGEISVKDACDGHSDDDAEQEGNNGKLFSSLEAHLGEEMKILSATISDVGVLEEVNYGVDEGDKFADFSDGINSEAKDSVHAGEQSTLCSPSEANNYEQHIVEADSMTEINSLFKCRMEEVLVQSISDPSIGQPLTVKPEDELSFALSSDSRMHVTEANPAEESNPQFVRLDEEALTCAACGSTCHNMAIHDSSSEALPAVNEHNSELPTEDGSRELLTAGDQQAAGISEAISDSALREPTDAKLEGEPNEPLATDAELPVLESKIS